MCGLFRAAFCVDHLYKRVCLNHECKADLRMWVHLLKHWNGISLFLDEVPTDVGCFGLFTDASGIGFVALLLWGTSGAENVWLSIQTTQPSFMLSIGYILPALTS